MSMKDRDQKKSQPGDSQLTQHGLLQRKCACGGTPGVDGECEECRAKHLSLQRSSAQPASPLPAVPPIVHEVLGSSGQPLDLGTRAFMEPHFGHDFSRVRVHADAKAAESARAVNALAYTVGRDVVFETGQYAPGTSKGRKLLAHELTHVVQQSNQSKALSSELVTDSADSLLEREAQQIAEEPESQPTVLRRVARPVIQRQQNPIPEIGGKVAEFNLYPEDFTYPFEFGEVSFNVTIALYQTAEMGESSGELDFSRGMSTEFELKAKQSIGEINFRGKAEPGKIPEMTLGFNNPNIDGLPVSVGFGGGVTLDFEKPFKIYGEGEFDAKELQIGELTFTGKVHVEADGYFKPNALWWASAAKTIVSTGRAAAAAASEVFFTGELGTVTSAGVVTAAGGVGLGLTAAEGFGLYEIGKADKEGQEGTIGEKFSEGYASLLAALTSNKPAFTETSEFDRLYDPQWKNHFEEAAKTYSQGGVNPILIGGAIDTIVTAGKSAILMDFLNYVAEHGTDSWNAIRQQHQKQYGPVEDERRKKYLAILLQQVDRGEIPPSIPLELSISPTIGLKGKE